MRLIIRLLCAAGAGMMVLVAYPVAAQQPPGPASLPPGTGRDIVSVACTQCHAPTTFTWLREGPNAWRQQVYEMVLHGAQVGPDEIDTVVNYLTSNFGPGVNLPPPLRPVTLPEGSGKDLVQGECALCHGLDRVTAVRRSAPGWTETLQRMVFYGAPVSPENEKTILAYLDAKYGVTQPSIGTYSVPR